MYIYIIYVIATSSVNEVLAAIAEWEKHTCLRFHKVKSEKNYIRFQHGSGCNSKVGRVNINHGPQFINLQQENCHKVSKNIIIKIHLTVYQFP